MSSAITDFGHHDAHYEPKGLGRWLTTTNHKDIGILYMLFGLTMFLLGGFFAELIRAQLIHPSNHLLTPEVYNQVITLHGLVMVFGAPDAGHGRLCELSHPADDRRARHGPARASTIGASGFCRRRRSFWCFLSS